MACCEALGQISEEDGKLTRTFASPAMRRANEFVGRCLRQAGFATRQDAAFNLIGRWNCRLPGAKTFLLGSHLDTVRDAGKYDGPLGVFVAIAAAQLLRQRGGQLPFHLEIVGFSDEEGVRYQTAYLGSGAFAGTLTSANLDHIEEKHIVRARRERGEFLGYAEVHIEQGPVLEKHRLPVGVVTAIAGQSRLRVEYRGVAGHAGTVPMNVRRDALAGAAEFILLVEQLAKKRPGLVATVGKIEAAPGASNVIPSDVALTLDVRSQNDSRRLAAVKWLHAKAGSIARQRGLQLRWLPVQDTPAIPCDKRLTRIFSECVARNGRSVLRLPSGAGHDAVAISAMCPVAMLFVRCRKGISHNPAESVATADVRVAIEVLADFLQTMAKGELNKL